MSKAKETKHRGAMYDIMRALLHNKLAVACILIISAFILISVFADVLFDYETQIAGMNAKQRLLGCSWEHPFGTDEYGRDLFARLLYGTKYSLAIGVSATLITALIGIPIGALAGYFGGLFEDIVMRLMDISLLS